MIAFALRRLLAIVPTLLVVATLSFVLLRLLPGGPFDAERAVPAEVARALDARYHLDEPLLRQYARWLGDLVLRGDLGPSYRYPNRSVGEIVALSLPVSWRSARWPWLFALALGVPLGVLGAARRGTRRRHRRVGRRGAGLSIPRFVLGPLLVLVFSLTLYLLPAARWETWRHMVLPVICAGLPTAAYVARLTQAGVVEVLRSDFIRTARAKGLGERAVLFRHALRGGLLPVVSFLGPAASGLLVGSLVVEKIFDVPGMGRYFVEAAQNRDYNLVLGVTLVYGAVVMTLNASADVAHAALDPRVRLRDAVTRAGRARALHPSGLWPTPRTACARTAPSSSPPRSSRDGPRVLLVPWLSPHRYDRADLALGATPPSWSHWMGTDYHGRDLLARVFFGGRVSFAVGLVATLVSFGIGVTWGGVAGYLGGRADAPMMRVVDALYTLPLLPLVILVMVFFGSDKTALFRAFRAVLGLFVAHPDDPSYLPVFQIVLVFAALGGISWLTMARIVRGQVLALREQPFVEAARSIGAGHATLSSATSSQRARAHPRVRGADRPRGDDDRGVPQLPRPGHAGAARRASGSSRRSGPRRWTSTRGRSSSRRGCWRSRSSASTCSARACATRSIRGRGCFHKQASTGVTR